MIDPVTGAPATGQHPQFFTTRGFSNGCLLLAFHGALDAAVAPSLLEELTEVTYQNIRVDLSKLDFIDSAGLSVLISTHADLQAQGRQLVLLYPQPQARSVFETTGVSEFLNIEYDASA